MENPFDRFAVWFAEAQKSELNDPHACALATVDTGGDGVIRPDVRIVLMKAFDARGFVFYTNFESAKGRQLRSHPVATLDFHWKSLRRQVRVSGPVAIVDAAEADAYFSTRPRESQLSAWASLQSQPLDMRETFEARLAMMEERYPAAVPRPEHWGGFRVAPNWIEYWEDRHGRQHHRERFDRFADSWKVRLLYP